MNKFYIITALSILACASANAKRYPTEFAKLQEAIKAHDAPQVKSIMRSVDKLTIAAQDKKQMLEDLQKLAIETAAESKTPLSYAKNWRDSWKTALGAWFIYSGIRTYLNPDKVADENVKIFKAQVKVYQDKNLPLPWWLSAFEGYDDAKWNEHRETVKKNAVTGAPFTVLLGAIPLYYGLKASNQKAVIEQAEDIEHFISNKLEDHQNPDAASKNSKDADEEEEL